MSFQTHTMTFTDAEPTGDDAGPRFSFTCSCGVSVTKLHPDDLISEWKAQHRAAQQPVEGA